MWTLAPPKYAFPNIPSTWIGENTGMYNIVHVHASCLLDRGMVGKILKIHVRTYSNNSWAFVVEVASANFSHSLSINLLDPVVPLCQGDTSTIGQHLSAASTCTCSIAWHEHHRGGRLCTSKLIKRDTHVLTTAIVMSPSAAIKLFLQINFFS